MTEKKQTPKMEPLFIIENKRGEMVVLQRRWFSSKRIARLGKVSCNFLLILKPKICKVKNGRQISISTWPIGINKGLTTANR
jgi:hypothetical protein